MEKSLERKNQHSTQLEISDSVKAVAKAIVNVNMLVSYKMETVEIIEWAKVIDKKLTEVGMEKLPFVIDCLIDERIPWDGKVGIQNIFRGLRQVYKDDEGKFQVYKNDIW